MLRKSFEILIEYHLLTLWLAYSSDISAILDAIKMLTTLVTIIVISTFFIYLLLLVALFRYVVAHLNNDMGLFGIANSGFYTVILGCWEIVEGCHQGCLQGYESSKN